MILLNASSGCKVGKRGIRCLIWALGRYGSLSLMAVIIVAEMLNKIYRGTDFSSLCQSNSHASSCSSITDLYSSLQSGSWVLHPKQSHRLSWPGAGTRRHRHREATVFRRCRGRRLEKSGSVAGGRPLRQHLQPILVHHQAVRKNFSPFFY